MIEARWKRALEALVVGAALLFLGLSLYRGWGEAGRCLRGARPWPLALSFALTLLHLLLGALGWRMAVRHLGGTLDLRRGMRVYFLSNLGRYLPGTFWYAAGRAYLGQQEDVPTALIATSLAMEVALILVSGALLSALALPSLLPGRGGLYLLAAVATLGLAALHPRPMNFLLGLLARLLHRQGVGFVAGYPLGLLALYLLIWAVAGAAFFLLLGSIYPVPLAWLPTVAAIYAASWIVGFLTPFAPGGLGVREGALALLLGRYVPLPVATAAALLSRLWLTLGEAVWVAVAARW